MKDSRDRIALVRKNKPAWQAGRLNGIGGGMEDGESPLASMRREWSEETDTFNPFWCQFATICFNEAVVHFFKASVPELPVLTEYNDIGEKLEVWDYSAAVRSSVVLPNLKWLLPMAFEDPDATFALLRPLPMPWHMTAANDNEPVVPVNNVRRFFDLPVLENAA